MVRFLNGDIIGYWYYLKYFNKELIKKGYDIKFYQKIDKEIINSDLIIVNSRIYTDTKLNLFKKDLTSN